MMEHGLLSPDRAKKAHKKKQRNQKAQRMGTPIKFAKPPSKPESSQRQQQASWNGDLKAKKRITNHSDDDDDFILRFKRRKRAEIMPSVEHLLAAADIQKLVFLDTAEGVTTTLRSYWSEATGDRATVVQAVPDMLEIVPHGTSKGRGVQMLLDHLGVKATEIMALGDGENDIEMLELASLGIALCNGAEKTKAVADAIGASNDEDGVADAIYRYAF